MKLHESYAHLGELGKGGVRAMAVGILSIGVAAGLHIASELEINNHEPLNIPGEVPLAVTALGGLTLLTGQRALLDDARKHH